MKVVWSPLAIARAAEIAAHIAEDRPLAAERWVTQLFARAGVLSRHPGSGHVVPEVGRSDIREIHHGVYRIIYRVEPKRVAVLTVRHGRRLLDLEELDSGVAG
ncbi:MAG: type II toxin-antitoxin system RelE/ParE family toxin [Gemmatimonadales bacterium]